MRAQTYRYWIDTGEVHDPLTHRFRMHHHHLEALDVGAMRRAAQLFVGTHDFTQVSVFEGGRWGGRPRRSVRHCQRRRCTTCACEAARGGLTCCCVGAQFSNHSVDTARRNPVKHVWRVEVADVPGGLMVEVSSVREQSGA